MNTVDILDTLENATTALSNSYAAAQAFGDPNLSRDGEQLEKVRIIGAARTEAACIAEAAITEAAGNAETAAAAAESHRPSFDENNAAQVIRTEQAWTNNVLPALKAGKTWDVILSSASADDLLAVERFARSWLVLNAGTESRLNGEVEDQYARIVSSARQQHARVATTQEGRDVITIADRAARDFYTISAIANEIKSARNRTPLLIAGISIKTARSNASKG